MDSEPKSTPTFKEIRYDRQLRLWGDHGQKSLEHARVCLLNATTLGSEILKSLILPGIGSFTIIDHRNVTDADVDTNFFLDVSKIGSGRAEAVCSFLKELNTDVRGFFLRDDVNHLFDKNLCIFDEFDIVIGTDLCEKSALEIADCLWQRRKPFLNCKCYGLIGYMRLSVPEHFVIESHPDNPQPNFMLDRPFASFKQYVDSIDLDSMNHEKHSHVPYLVLLMKALNKWTMLNSNSSGLPQTSSERSALKQILLDMRMPDEKGNFEEENFREAVNNVVRSVKPTTIPDSCRKIFSSPQCLELASDSQSFWIIANALKRFVEDAQNGSLPLRGDLPDMIADSKSYIELQNIFYEQSDRDAKIVHNFVVDNLNRVKSPTDSITMDETRLFCKNFAFMSVVHGRSLRSEFENESKNLNAIREKQIVSGDGVSSTLNWYIVLRAAESFFSQKARYPGTNGIPVELDKNDLKYRVEQFLKFHNLDPIILDNEIEEMCRYGAAEIHSVASFVGGMAAQEVIKLITKQYVPLNNTLIFDANTGNANMFEL